MLFLLDPLLLLPGGVGGDDGVLLLTVSVLVVSLFLSLSTSSFHFLSSSSSFFFSSNSFNFILYLSLSIVSLGMDPPPNSPLAVKGVCFFAKDYSFLQLPCQAIFVLTNNFEFEGWGII